MSGFQTSAADHDIAVALGGPAGLGRVAPYLLHNRLTAQDEQA